MSKFNLKVPTPTNGNLDTGTGAGEKGNESSLKLNRFQQNHNHNHNRNHSYNSNSNRNLVESTSNSYRETMPDLTKNQNYHEELYNTLKLQFKNPTTATTPTAAPTTTTRDANTLTTDLFLPTRTSTGILSKRLRLEQMKGRLHRYTKAKPRSKLSPRNLTPNLNLVNSNTNRNSRGFYYFPTTPSSKLVNSYLPTSATSSATTTANSSPTSTLYTTTTPPNQNSHLSLTGLKQLLVQSPTSEDVGLMKVKESIVNLELELQLELVKRKFLFKFVTLLIQLGLPSYSVQSLITKLSKRLQLNCLNVAIVNYVLLSVLDLETRTCAFKLITADKHLDVEKLNRVEEIFTSTVYDNSKLELEKLVDLYDTLKETECKPVHLNQFIRKIVALFLFNFSCSLIFFNLPFLLSVTTVLTSTIILIVYFVIYKLNLKPIHFTSITYILLGAFTTILVNYLATDSFILLIANPLNVVTTIQLLLALKELIYLRCTVSGVINFVYSLIEVVLFGFCATIGLKIPTLFITTSNSLSLNFKFDKLLQLDTGYYNFKILLVPLLVVSASTLLNQRVTITDLSGCVRVWLLVSATLILNLSLKSQFQTLPYELINFLSIVQLQLVYLLNNRFLPKYRFTTKDPVLITNIMLLLAPSWNLVASVLHLFLNFNNLGEVGMSGVKLDAVVELTFLALADIGVRVISDRFDKSGRKFSLI